VVSGAWENAFACVRPPGHHSDMKGKIEGFCVYNNVAIGAKYALKKYDFINKVLIFDWDVHHGNSTYKFLKDDPNILFISIHRYDDG